MSRRIWKYQIPFYHRTVAPFAIPERARLVHVAAEGDSVSLWFEVAPENPKEPRVFEIFGTGHSIPESAGDYVGTVIAPPLVLHVYERGL